MVRSAASEADAGNTMRKLSGLAVLACAGILMGGCAETRRVDPAAPTAFLGPELVARLQPTEDGVLAYADAAADFRRYRRMMIAPVQILIPPGGTPLTAEQRRFVAGAVQDALRTELGRDFEIVSAPGPATILLSAAISEVREGGNPALATASNFMPLTRLAREGVALVAGSDPLVGGAAGEVKLTDAETGRILAAAIDSRDATAGMRARGSSLDDVVFVAQYWARLTALRLCRLQQRDGCRPAG
jgi:hypothetical protein